MACIQSPTLTLYSTSTSSTVITTSTVSVQTQPDGSVSTITIPLIVTSIVTIVDPTSTLYASCSSTSTPISTIPSSLSQSTETTPQPSQSPSYAPTTIVITTTPSPTVITTAQSSTLNNGAITVITITTTSTPSPAVVVIPTSVTATQTQASKSSSSNIGPIAGGAAGGFIILIGVVALVWYLFKKCRKPDGGNREEDEVVLPFPVTRDRERVDLSGPYEYSHVGRPMSTSTTGQGSSPGINNTYASHGRRDSATAALISPGLTPMASNSGTLSSIAVLQNQVRGGEVGRQPSRGSAHQLPPGAAPPGTAPPLDHYSASVTGRSSVSGSSTTAPGPTSRRPLQVTNAALSPISMQSGFSPGDVLDSGSGPMVVPESARPEKQDVSSSSAPFLVHSDGGLVQSSGHRPSTSGSGSALVPERKPSTQPEPTSSSVEPNEPPPAYAA